MTELKDQLLRNGTRKPCHCLYLHSVMKEIQIRGARNAVRQDFVDVLELMKKLDLPIERLVSRDVPLAEAGEALQSWSDNPAAITKILVSFE